MKNMKPRKSITDRRTPVYPPSILVIEDNAYQSLTLKPGLENNGCWVQQIGSAVDELSAVQHKFFDLIILNLELYQSNHYTICQKIETDPELNDIPTVLVLPHHLAGEVGGNLNTKSVYYLSKDAFIMDKLVQIIKHIQYLTYRYT